MMSRDEALSFAERSAVEALDQKEEYDDAFMSYYKNVIDTLNDYNLSEYKDEALEAYIKRYAILITL